MTSAPPPSSAVPTPRRGGFLGFTVVWAGQLTSILGTQMTAFAVLIYAWTTTQSATVMALVGIASFAPAVLFSPVAGTLADGTFEPGMRVGGTLAPAFGGLVGTGAGTGMALLIVLAGLAGTLVGAAGYAFRSVREVERLLPDHDAVAGLGVSPSDVPPGDEQQAK